MWWHRFSAAVDVFHRKTPSASQILVRCLFLGTDKMYIHYNMSYFVELHWTVLCKPVITKVILFLLIYLVSSLILRVPPGLDIKHASKIIEIDSKIRLILSHLGTDS